jgi:hypothetical protein
MHSFILNYTDGTFFLGPVVPGDYLNRIVDAPAILEFYDWPIAKALAAFDKFTKLLGG